MEQLIEKTSDQIKKQMEFWFLAYFSITKADVTRDAVFTLFELLNTGVQEGFKQKMALAANEIPVLILRVSNAEYIVNTTERFVRLDRFTTESIYYSEFKRHAGFWSVKARPAAEEPLNIHKDGSRAGFGLMKRNETLVYWTVPTGKPGFGFWNVTKKCELIGRKYRVVE